MAMTRKDYQTIAAAIRASGGSEILRHRHAMEAVEDVATHLAAVFSMQYDNFNTNTFLSACVPQEIHAEVEDENQSDGDS